ncbi:nucleotidyltransferase domain-containing protein [Vallitalea okinawensis]|uniref:nucleotidyltransferase domain-containing protein n=1 Tax=Vallitalea okinawensis TaxID=2078660 RepID=UPI001A9A6435|nr:hypothetical protein [Vallitalea okinawensis]
MKITFEDSGNYTVFRISDFDVKYEKILEMCFYEKDEDSYKKLFLKDTPNMNRIKDNYKSNAEKMFSQVGYFTPIPWEKALLEFAKKVDEKGIDWWLTGSCAACIRGIPLNPHDVDIMIDSKDANKIGELFVNYIVEPIIDTNGWLTKDFGVLFLHARIDIASDPQACLDDPEPVDCGPYAKEHLEVITWNGYEIKVPPLSLQLYVNKLRGRNDRVKLIENYMKEYD